MYRLITIVSIADMHEAEHATTSRRSRRAVACSGCLPGAQASLVGQRRADVPGFSAAIYGDLT